VFNEIIDKIKQAPFSTEPFRHIEIDEILPDTLFREVISAPEIALSPVDNDRQLVDSLDRTGWKPIPFPGTTENVETYLKWHESGGKVLNTNTCEGFGITFRLFEPKSSIMKELNEFLGSSIFKNTLMEKFDIASDGIIYDAGVQKYLDGYEISPHPDIRRKALTYMVNINPAANSEQLGYHTHYMKFRPAKDYVRSYWQHNVDSERCWVPWDWCSSEKQQTRNNSMVIFSPSHDTLHAVLAKYDHLASQRTQLYGNFWYGDTDKVTLAPDWEHYVVGESGMAGVKRLVPDFIKKPLKILAGRGSLRAGKRAVRT